MSEEREELMLPHGWVVKTSRKHPDRVYYYNNNTGSSTWDCPELVPKRKGDGLKAPEAKRTIHTIHSNHSPEESQSLFRKPPTAIVNPVTTGPDRQPSTSSDTSLGEYQSRDTTPTSSNFISAAVTQTSLPAPIDSSAVSVSSYTPIVPPLNMQCLEDLVEKISKSTFLKHHYMVVTTSMFLDELDNIDMLKDLTLARCGPPHLFMPFIVLKELDRMKKSPDGQEAYLARRAIRVVHDTLKSAHPRFHGLNAKQAEDCKTTTPELQTSYTFQCSRKNYDRYIDVCKVIQKKVPHEKVILLTNDEDLSKIAKDFNIITHDWESLMKNIKPDIDPVREFPENFELRYKPWRNITDEEKSTFSHNKPGEPTYLELKHSGHVIVDQIMTYRKEIDKLMERAQQLLKDVLDPILVAELGKVLDEMCLNCVVNRNLLKEIVKAYITHWPILFCHRFSDNPLHCFELLHQKLSCKEGQCNTLEYCLEVLNLVQVILKSFRVQDPRLCSFVSQIEDIKFQCTRIFRQLPILYSSLSIVESYSRQNENEVVLKIFDFNWQAVNDLCGMLMDFFEIQHSLTYVKPKKLPSESEYRLVACDLFPYVGQLKHLMNEMLINVRDSSTSREVFKKLHKALLELIPSLQIRSVRYVLPDVRCFTYTTLENFCRDPENRQKIEIGIKQVDRFTNKLKEVFVKMIKTKEPQKSLLCDK